MLAVVSGSAETVFSASRQHEIVSVEFSFLSFDFTQIRLKSICSQLLLLLMCIPSVVPSPGMNRYLRVLQRMSNFIYRLIQDQTCHPGLTLNVQGVLE